VLLQNALEKFTHEGSVGSLLGGKGDVGRDHSDVPKRMAMAHIQAENQNEKIVRE